MTKKARYDLQQVFAIIDSGKTGCIWFPAPSRSVLAVVRVYEKTATPKDLNEAKEFILAGIRALKDGDFVDHNYQWETTHDIYGIVVDGRPWYVKFCIDGDGDLSQVSFHPPERELKTVDGHIIAAG